MLLCHMTIRGAFYFLYNIFLSCHQKQVDNENALNTLFMQYFIMSLKYKTNISQQQFPKLCNKQLKEKINTSINIKKHEKLLNYSTETIMIH